MISHAYSLYELSSDDERYRRFVRAKMDNDIRYFEQAGDELWQFIQRQRLFHPLIYIHGTATRVMVRRINLPSFVVYRQISQPYKTLGLVDRARQQRILVPGRTAYIASVFEQLLLIDDILVSGSSINRTLQALNLKPHQQVTVLTYLSLSF